MAEIHSIIPFVALSIAHSLTFSYRNDNNRLERTDIRNDYWLFETKPSHKQKENHNQFTVEREMNRKKNYERKRKYSEIASV